MDSHLKMTIAQFIRDANPGMTAFTAEMASQKAAQTKPPGRQIANNFKLRSAVGNSSPWRGLGLWPKFPE
jgi:hypothetical protein